MSSGIYLAELTQTQNSKWEDISGTPQDDARAQNRRVELTIIQ